MRISLGLLLWLLLPLSAHAGDGFPAPPDADVQVVAASTTALGMSLRIRRFEVDMPVEQVLEFYRNLWDEDFAETEMSPWKMIGSRRGDEYHNVQVQKNSAGKSWGYLSISDLPGRLDDKTYSIQVGKSFPMMSGSRLLDDQLSNDVGKTGRVLLIRNGFSPRSNAIFYRKHYQRQGWELLMNETTRPRQRGYALLFRKAHQTVGFTINEMQGQTLVVANPVDRGMLQ